MKKRDLSNTPGFTVAIMIFATLISKVLGMVRQMMTTSIFAAGMEGIAFSAASKIPLSIFDMLFSAAVLGSFLPIYRGNLTKDEARAHTFSRAFFSCITAVTAAVAMLGIVFSKEIISIAAPNLDEETAELAGALLSIMFPAVIFAGAAYILVGILQSHERFLLPAFVSAISNLVMILYLAIFPRSADKTAVYGLAVAYLVSWAVQFLTLAVPLFRSGRFPAPTRTLRNPDLKEALRRSLPVMFGSWLLPMTTLIANAFSSFIPSETIEADAETGAAIVVYETALSVFTIAAGLMTYGICNYIFPKLSARSAEGDEKSFARLSREGLFASLSLILPVAIAVFLLSDEIIRLLYLRGNFTEGLALGASRSLRMLALAMPAYGITELLSRVCYSCGKVKIPMLSALLGILTATLAYSIFFLTDTLTVEAAALASTLAMIASALVLLIFVFFHFSDIFRGGSFKKLLSLVSGTVLCAAVMRVFHALMKQFSFFSDTFQNFITIAIVFTMGIVVYLIWLIMTKTIVLHKNHPERGN